MAQCYDADKKQYISCTSNTATYIICGIIIPIVVVLSNFLIFACIRYRKNLARREQQQTNLTTVVSIDNNDEEQQPPYNYPNPPQYTSIVDSDYDKPPSYEQSVQQLSEINSTSRNTAAILPITTVISSTPLAQSPQNQP